MASSRRPPSVRSLHFERLESRRVLSITVDTLADENNGVGVGEGTSLREALTAAVAGDTIDFSVAGTIKLARGSLPTINKNLIINGPGANLLTIDANDPTPMTKNGDGIRVFRIADNNPQHLLDVSISGLTLTGGDLNSFSGGGGGAISSYENLVVSDCVIVGNSSGTGGSVQYMGGAIQSIPEGEQFGLPTSLTVRNSVLSGNSTQFGAEGGAIRKRLGTLVVEDCIITGNSAYYDGGGVSASDSVSVQINRSTINNNWTTYPSPSSYGYGGGVFVLDGTVSISASTISGNTANFGGGFGSPPGRPASLTMTNSTVSGNTARIGGGINAAGGAVITSSTISGNTATISSGAIYSGTVLTINSSTITANTSPAATTGAVRSTASASFSRVSSSIIAGNTNGDVGSSMTSLGYNLIGTGNGFTATGDQKGVTNPMLGLLADNGGPTKTHMPLAGSPSIDAGNPTFNPTDPDGNPSTNDAMPFDQRGAPLSRVYDGDGKGGLRIDKGAIERQPIPPAVMGDYNQDGTVDSGDYVLWRKTIGTTGLTPYTGADGTGNGTVDDAELSLWRAHFGSAVPAAATGAGLNPDATGVQLGNVGTRIAIAPQLDFDDVNIDSGRQILRDAVDGRKFRRPIPTSMDLNDLALVSYLASHARETCLVSPAHPTVSADPQLETVDEAIELDFAGLAAAI